MHEIEPMAGLPVSRRMLGRLVTGMAAASAMPAYAVALSPGTGCPVIGFHADAPWIDPTGRAKPFYPPSCTGAFAPDSESLMRLGHFL